MPEQLTAPRCKPDPDYAVVNVMFEREVSGDELDSLRESHRSGVIAADPDRELSLALAQQLAAELQAACDRSGLAGRFLVHNVVPGVRFDDDPESPTRPRGPRP